MESKGAGRSPGGGGGGEGRGGGTPIWNRRGCLSEFLNETIWARLKLFVTPKGDQSGHGLSKF